MRTPAEHLAKFNETIAILVKAYLDNKFISGDFCGCAVGNLVESACGYTRVVSGKSCSGRVVHTWVECDLKDGDHWGAVFMTSADEQQFHIHMYDGEAKRQIDATGYTVRELARVEKAFESAHWEYWMELGRPDKKWEVDTFPALMAVVDVLASIHGVDLETTEAARKMFVKA